MLNRLDAIKTFYKAKSEVALAALLGVHRNTLLKYRTGMIPLPDDLEARVAANIRAAGDLLDRLGSTPDTPIEAAGAAQLHISPARYRIGDCLDLAGNMLTRQQAKLLKADSLWWEHEWIDERNGHPMFNLYRRAAAGSSHCSTIRLDAATWQARMDFGPAELELLEYLNGLLAAKREAVSANSSQ
jgi:hypothetical protein